MIKSSDFEILKHFFDVDRIEVSQGLFTERVSSILIKEHYFLDFTVTWQGKRIYVRIPRQYIIRNFMLPLSRPLDRSVVPDQKIAKILGDKINNFKNLVLAARAYLKQADVGE